MSKSTSERTPTPPRFAVTRSQIATRYVSWLGASAAIALAAACSENAPVKPPTPPVVEPAGIIVKLALDSKFQPGVIEQLDVVVDAASGGPSLGLDDEAGATLTHEGTTYSVEVRSIDTDEDAEVVATIRGNPFAQGATSVSVFVPTPTGIGAEGVPFQIRLAARGAMGTLSALTLNSRPGGPLAFPLLTSNPKRYTLEATLPCIPNVSCKSTTNRPPAMASFGTVPLVVRRWWPVELRPRAVDPDGDKLTYSVVQEDVAALPGGNASYNAATNTFTWTPPPDAQNFMGRGADGMPMRIKPSWRVRFRANDGKGGEAEQAALIDVVQPNSNPVWSPAPAITAVEETEVQLNLSVKDPDGEPIDFELDTVKLPPGANAAFDEDLGVFTWTPTYDDARARPYLVRVYARDQSNGFALLEIPVTVVDRNRPPIFLTPTETTFKAGVAGTFRVRAFDPDGDQVILGVDANGLPAGARASLDVNAGLFTWTPNAADARDTPYILRLNARDTRGESISTTVAIRVTSNNSAPVFTTLPTTLTVQESETWTSALAAMDPDGDPVELVADYAGLPTNHGATLANGTATWRPAQGMARSEPYRIAFVARDNKGASTRFESLFLVTRFVPGAPPPPVFTGTLPPSPANENSPALRGTTEPNNTITLYANADCSGDFTTFEEADAMGNFAINVDVPDNSTTVWSATATNRRERVSECTVMPVRYVEDSTPPAQPVLTSVTPASPSNNNNPELVGTAEPGSTVLVYAAPIVMSVPPLPCNGTPAFTLAADAMGAFRVVAPVADNSKTMFTVKAVDAAGNQSACSLGTQYEEDSRIPPIVTLVPTTIPASPSKQATFVMNGTGELNARVSLFRDAACTDPFPIEPLLVTAANGSFSFRVTVEPNTTTRLWAQQQTPVGNKSLCSTDSVTYVMDATPPAAPMITATLPASPTNQNPNAVEVTGTVEADTVSRLYLGSTCSGMPVGEPATGVGGAFSFTVQLPANATTQLVAIAADRAGNESPCSAPFTFVHDNVQPGVAALQGTTPASPSATSTTPSIRGSAEAGATVKLFASPDCGGAVAGTAVSDANQLFNAVVTVPANATTSITATVTDVAGNVSLCSPPITYTHDNTPPEVPTSLTTSPTSPSRSELNPRVRGVTAAGTTVRVYQGEACTGSPVATGTAEAFNSQGIIVTVGPNASTTIRVTAVDAAGNESGCSTPLVYAHDNIAPPVPTGLTTAPTSPSRTELLPHFKGQAEAGSTVSLYLTTDCTGTPVITGTAAEFAADGIVVPTTANSSIDVRVTATDAAGNPSPCSPPINFTHDTIVPAAPGSLAVEPTSPSREVQNPRVKGTAEANSTVTLFTTANCSGQPVGTGPASDFTTIGVVANLPANSSNELRAIATDRAGNASLCSTSFAAYRHDNTPPAAPTGVTSSPLSPNRADLNPRLKATLEAGTVTVRIYRTADCSGQPAALVAAAELTGDGVMVPAFPNQATEYRFITIDDAGNESACSAPFIYIHDDQPPAAPTALATTPASPSNATTSPGVKGQTEAGATLTFFTNAECTGEPVATGLAAVFTGAVGVPVPVTANGTTAVRAKATDGAGNTSPCSEPVSYTHDNVAPAAPAEVTVTPASPSSTPNPIVKGTAEAGSTVKIWATANCSGATPLATGTAELFAGDGIPVPVPQNAATTLGLNATDAAGNVSVACTNLPYTHDSIAPQVAVLTRTVPASPSRSVIDPLIEGTAENDALVQLFTTADCSGEPAATGTATAQGAFSIQLAVSGNSTTTVRAKARDAAGNLSPCSTTSLTYVHDSLSPETVAVTPTENLFLNQVLTCVASGAVGEGVTYEYQWRRAGVDIAEATQATYTIAAADRGVEVKCFARARLGEQVSQYLGSNGLTAVNRAVPAFTSTVNGTPTSGATLTCTGDYSSPDPDGEAVTVASVLWESTNNGTAWVPVVGATGEAIVTDNTDLNRSFRCTMTVREAGGLNTVGATSAVFGPILPPIQPGPVTCNEPPFWAFYRQGMAVGDVFGVTCTTSDPQLVPYIVSGTCPSLSFTGTALTGTLPASGNGCHLTVGARTSAGVVCTGCATDTLKLRVAKQVKELVTCNTPENLGSEPASMFSFNDGNTDKLFFTAFVDPPSQNCDEGGARAYKLFISDGTANGTNPIAHSDTLQGVPVTAQKLGAGLFHQGAFYVSVDSVILKSTGEMGELSVFASGVGFAKQLIFHDGFFFALTDDGLKKITTGGVVGSIADAGPGVGPMVVFQGALYFGFRAASGQPLSKSESPYEETTAVGASTLAPDSLTVFNSKLYFAANGPTAGVRQLQSYNGTTFAVEFDMPAYGSSLHEVLGLAVRSNVLYFTSTTVEAPASDFYTSIYRLETTGAPKRIVTTVSPNRVPKRVLLPGIDGVLGVVFSPNSEPLTMQAYPNDSPTEEVARFMTGPFYDRATGNYTTGANQVIPFPQLVSTSTDEELLHRATVFNGEVYFAGQSNGSTTGFELWKLTDPKATDAPAP